MIRFKKLLVFFAVIGILAVSVCALAIPSYTKLDAQGNVLPDSATSWSMVKDNVTGLIWENKTDNGSIHDKDNTYNWDNAQNVFIATLNAQKFGGFSDWRLPTVEELISIANAEPYDPATNTDYFSNFISSTDYWSSDIFTALDAIRAAYTANQVAYRAALDAAEAAYTATHTADYYVTYNAAVVAYAACYSTPRDVSICPSIGAAQDAAEAAYRIYAPANDAAYAAYTAAANAAKSTYYTAYTAAYTAAVNAAHDACHDLLHSLYRYPNGSLYYWSTYSWNDYNFQPAYSYVERAIAVRSGQADEPPTPAGITVTPATGLETTEDGGTAEFTVVLNTEPIANVTIDISSSDLTEGGRYPLSLTFTSDNWDVPQIVTVYGLNDDTVDGDVAYAIITEPAESDDPDYNGLDADDVSAINRDNDSCPTVVGHTPIDSANVPTDTAITISFSKAMDQSTTEAAFSIDPAVSGNFNFTWSNEDRTFTFTPPHRLSQEQQYTVRIGSTATDTEGNSLQAAYTFSFTTRKELEASINYYPKTFDNTDGYYPLAHPMVGGLIVFKASTAYVSGTPGDIVDYEWDFGDETIVNETDSIYDTPGRMYTSPGKYTVTLTVTDNHGLKCKVSKELDLTLEMGDIILVRSYNSPVPFSEWTHAMIYIGNNQVAEAVIGLAIMGKGVTISPLSDYFFSKCTYATVLRVKTTDDIKRKAVDFAIGKFKSEYDLASLFKSFYWFIDDNLKQIDGAAWYCSELVWAAYMHASNNSINLESDDVDIITSDDIYFNTSRGTVEVIGEHKEQRPSVLWEKDTLYRLINPFVVALHSPVDLQVTDPDGLVFNKQVNEIPGAVYEEADIDGDGDTEGFFIVPNPKPGDYLIEVIPKPDALPSDTYTLETIFGNKTTILSKDTPISEIPAQPYSVMVPAPEDLNGDGRTDKADLDLLLSHRNKPASECPECDLDGDGRVSVLDARKLVLSCTCPRCVCP